MSEQSKNSTDKADRDILYSFWDNLPKASFFDVEKEILQSHPARSQILRILKQGLEDGSNGRIRYALSAQEIRKLLKKRANITMSATNVYFHLNTLEEHKLIHVVSTILEKRHKVAYYGRSAQHLFIRPLESRLQSYVEQAEEFSKFAKALNLDFNYSKFESIPEKYHDIKSKREEVLGQWIIQNEEILEQKNLNMNRIFDFMKLIDSTNSEYLGLFREFQKFLDAL
ncbi:MAG: winged helix-turn-helix domain-containing protein [Candidatus Thorarchaeota archaeon]